MKKRVLIAEDDVDLGHLLRQYLELNGFEATRVFTGKEARALLSENSFDIAILDIMMPELDGLTLGAKLKKSYPDLPFLFITAKKTRDDILAGLKLGANVHY
jgi:DNA-binding response OmpR family regulator